MKNIGKRIKACREDLGLSMTDLAGQTGLTISAISQFENEKDLRVPSLDSLQKLADTFEVTTDYLLGREEEISDKNIMATFRGLQKMNEKDKKDMLQFYQFLKAKKEFKDQKKTGKK